MSLIAIITAAILSLVPPLGDSRAAKVAEDIAATGASKQEALILTTIAFHESSFGEAVESCRVTGDDGRSVGAFQVRLFGDHREELRAALCGDARYAARYALGRVRTCAAQRGIEPSEIFGCYAGALAKSAVVRRRVATYERLLSMADGS